LKARFTADPGGEAKYDSQSRRCEGKFEGRDGAVDEYEPVGSQNLEMPVVRQEITAPAAENANRLKLKD
jgi:hypothetical protein